MGGILRRLALNAGFRSAFAWIREAQVGQRGADAQGFVTWCLAHVAELGLVFGCAIAAGGIYFGPDSQTIGVLTGFASAVLIPAGIIPAAWQSQPDTLKQYNWYAIARNNSAEIGALLSSWAIYNSGGCSADGGLAIGPLLIPCGLSAFLYAFFAGTLTHLGIVSSAMLAPAPAVPIPVKVKAP